MKTPVRPKYDFPPHITIKRVTRETSMSHQHHLDVVEEEFYEWLRRHKWKQQAAQFRKVCANVKQEFPDYDTRLRHIEYFINMTLEGLKGNVSRLLDAS